MGRPNAAFAVRSLAVPLALLAAVLLSGGAPVRADGEKAGGVWIYDLRVVQVETTAPEVVETRPEFEPAGPDGTTTRAAWADLLAGLKARGKTTLLLDQRATALPGERAKVQQSRDRQVATLQNLDSENQRWQSASIPAGTTAELSAGEGRLTYQVSVKFELAAAEGELRAVLGTVEWLGTHPELAGDTIVLRHCEQVAYEGRPPRGLEVYAFLTASLAGAR